MCGAPRAWMYSRSGLSLDLPRPSARLTARVRRSRITSRCTRRPRLKMRVVAGERRSVRQHKRFGAKSIMSNEEQLSPSGVRIATDFRSNLIIDRYDPVFADMRASKIKHLRSVNSEDAITWNVFRSLRQVDPAVWLPRLWTEAFPSTAAP